VKETPLALLRATFYTEKQSAHRAQLITDKEWHMQSTNIRQIKAAIRDQAFLGNARVSCSFGNIVAIRRRKGQLLAMIRGWGRWYPVGSVSIEYAGPQLLR
jgi:hypothetical protein